MWGTKMCTRQNGKKIKEVKAYVIPIYMLGYIYALLILRT